MFIPRTVHLVTMYDSPGYQSWRGKPGDVASKPGGEADWL